jgi:NitT/TauT family transport system substrate-binding protein
MRRRSAIAALAATGLYAARPQRLAAQGTSLPKIRVGAPETDALTPLFYGMRNGAFQKAGLDVEFVSTNNGTAATAAVLAGTYQLSYPSIVTTMNAHLRDVPLALIAPGAIYTAKNPFGLLQVAADSPIKSAADLNNKIIGVSALNSSTGLVVSAWVDKNGGDSRTLKYVEIPFAVTESALVGHRIDCSMMLEPMLTSSLSSGKTRTLGDAFAAIASTFMVAAYVGRPDWATENADTVRKFLKVLSALTTDTNAHPAETAALMSDVTKIPLPIMQKMTRVVNATSLEPGLVQPFIDAAAKYHVITRDFPAKEFFWNDVGPAH